ncbi:MAG: methylmalonyl-CoA mutase family protein [Pseudomonadota bacterium]
MHDDMEKIRREKDKWFSEKFVKQLECLGLQSPPSKGDKLPLYTPADVENDYLKDLGFPGEFPYTRGVYPGMYLDKLWVMRQIAGYGTARETNERFKYLLENGETGVTAVFDFPTVMGLDSDNPMAAGEVGRCGVPIDSVEDMRILFDGIPIDRVHVALLSSYPSSPAIFAAYIAMAMEKGLAIPTLAGSIQNHFLAFYTALPKCAKIPPRDAVRLAVDTFEYCTKHMPRWTPINITAHVIRESGATMVQELCYCLANAMAYVEGALERGLDVDSFGPKLAFYFTAGMNMFEEVAKFRAARRLWAKIMKERYKAENPASQMIRFHAQGSAFTVTAEQPLNNLIRSTIQTLAGALGGAQSINVNPFDESLSIPSEESVRLALRTSQIIAYETGITETIDPLGGSYYIEALTNKIEEDAGNLLKAIEEMGDGSMLDGVIKGIESGYFMREVSKAAHDYHKEVESGERVVVGLNQYRVEEEIPIELLTVDLELERIQVENLKKLREERDEKMVREALEKVREGAEGSENLIPLMIEAVRANATVGEITDAIVDVFGLYQPKSGIL